jgi:hypothetical protein
VEHRPPRRPGRRQPLWQTPDLKTRLPIHSGAGLFDSISFPATNSYLALMASNGIAVETDFIQGGHEWYVWRQLLHDFAATLAFRHTTISASAPATIRSGHPARFVATVRADTTEPARPTGSVSFYLDGIVDAAHLLGTAAVHAGTARVTTHRAIDVGTHTVTAIYSGDTLYNPSSSNAAAFTVVAKH